MPSRSISSRCEPRGLARAGSSEMSKSHEISRRQFVTTAVSAAAVSSLAVPEVFGRVAKNRRSAGVTNFSDVSLTDAPPWKDQAIENLAKSPYAKLRQIPVHAVTIRAGFWAQRREVNVSKSIPTMHDLLEANGRMNNFRRLAGKSDAAQSGPVFSDSDVYKWTEAVGFALQSGDLPDVRRMAANAIDEVVAVQEPDGYLSTYYVEDRKSLRMTPQTQSTGHELYNI